MLTNMIAVIYSKACSERPAEDREDSANERTVEANSEHPRMRNRKHITDSWIVAPATFLSDIKMHTELKITTKTMTGARDMNHETNVSTTMANSSILVGEAYAMRTPSRKKTSNQYSRRILVLTHQA
jgi:hypothetical protein